MRARANTRISILRGTATNDYDDEVDTLTVVATGVPFSLLEQDRRVYIPAEQAVRIVRSYAGRCAPNVDLRKDDRIRDEADGKIYLVVSLHAVKSPVYMPDLTVELSYTN